MLILPLLAIVLFGLILGFKLLGGNIAWWIIITLGIVILVPMLLLFLLEIISRFRS